MSGDVDKLIASLSAGLKPVRPPLQLEVTAALIGKTQIQQSRGIIMRNIGICLYGANGTFIIACHQIGKSERPFRIIDFCIPSKRRSRHG